MKKLKSFSEIESFRDASICKSNQVNILGGQTLDYYATITSTCEWSCQDSQIETYQDGVHTGSHRLETENDC
ncbi:hypothetical protein [Psychroserpens sp. MEBiC05023]